MGAPRDHTSSDTWGEPSGDESRARAVDEVARRRLESGFRRVPPTLRRAARLDIMPRHAASPPVRPPHHSHLRYNLAVVSRGGVAALPAFEWDSLVPAGRGGLLAVVVGLAVVAVVALLVAAAAYANDPRRRRRSAEDEEELFTTTPLPMPKEELERMAKEPPPQAAFRSHHLPRWVQVGSVVAALAITWVVAGRLRERADRARAGSADSSELGAPGGGDPSAVVIPAYPRENSAGDDLLPFALRAREWRSTDDGAGCTGRLDITRGAPGSWTITVNVDDAGGAPLDSARARVRSATEGTAIEVTFPRTPCPRIGAWRVTGRPAGDRTPPPDANGRESP